MNAKWLLIALVSRLYLFTVFSVNQLMTSGLRYQTARQVQFRETDNRLICRYEHLKSAVLSDARVHELLVSSSSEQRWVWREIKMLSPQRTQQLQNSQRGSGPESRTLWHRPWHQAHGLYQAFSALCTPVIRSFWRPVSMAMSMMLLQWSDVIWVSNPNLSYSYSENATNPAAHQCRFY